MNDKLEQIKEPKEQLTISIKEIDNGFIVFSQIGEQIFAPKLEEAVVILESLFKANDE